MRDTGRLERLPQGFSCGKTGDRFLSSCAFDAAAIGDGRMVSFGFWK
jgi:hypothetical protein